jgi:ribosomal protein S18 acetylase RimI-like enzyme
MKITGPDLNQASLCKPILYMLPDWFGQEDTNRKYLVEIQNLPTFIAWKANQAIGFLTIKQHNPFSAEIHITGVKPEFHRQGIGAHLVTAAEVYLRAQNVEYLQVKTLGPSHSDPFYARTRAFYEKSGFRPLEEIPQIWNAENPCLIMIKRI